MNEKRLKTKDIVLMAILTSILFVQEELLTFLPNIQLTIFLIILYTKNLGYHKTIIIVFIHVILDNLVMGSFNIATVPAMMIGWLFIPLTLGTIFKKIEKPLSLALLSIIYVLFYDLCFAISNLLILDISIIAYFVGSIVFDLILIASSFLSILWLYKPLSKVINLFNDTGEE